MRKNLSKINSDFSIQSFEGGYDKNFSYLLSCLQTMNSVIIDASIKPNALKPFQKSNPIAILITHSHNDHIRYINDYRECYPNIKLIGHPRSLLNKKRNNFLSVNDNAIINLGNLEIKIIHTPGHYFDSACFLVGDAIFTGDTIFIGRTGRTISKGSDTKDLYNSVYNKLFKLPHNTMIYPGHNYGPKPSMTIADNIKEGSLLRAKSENDFMIRMRDYEQKRLKGS